MACYQDFTSVSEAREDGQRAKTNIPDVSILLDLKWCHWVEKVVAILHTGDKEAVVFPFSYHQFRTEIIKACQRMQGARAVAHGPERPALRETQLSDSRLFGAASSIARRDRNLRTTCRGSHPWNLSRFCLHQRLKRQYILHPFVHSDVVTATFEHTEFLVIQCVRIRRS